MFSRCLILRNFSLRADPFGVIRLNLGSAMWAVFVALATPFTDPIRSISCWIIVWDFFLAVRAAIVIFPDARVSVSIQFKVMGLGHVRVSSLGNKEKSHQELGQKRKQSCRALAEEKGILLGVIP